MEPEEIPDSPCPKAAPLPPPSMSAESTATVSSAGEQRKEDWPVSDDEGPSFTSSVDTAGDDDWAPQAPPKAKGKKIIKSDDEDEGDFVVKVSKNAAGPRGSKRKAPPPAPLYDVSIDEIPVVRIKRSKGMCPEDGDEGDDAIKGGEDAAPIPTQKKKKRYNKAVLSTFHDQLTDLPSHRHLSGKAGVTEDQILEVTNRIEANDRPVGKGKTTHVRRMVS